MEQLLRGEKISEIETLLLFPVRHHSPVCAFHLKKAIADYSPDLILIEGPENADFLIPALTDPDSEAPLAFYYAYRDSNGYLGKKMKLTAATIRSSTVLLSFWLCGKQRDLVFRHPSSTFPMEKS